jgi:CHAT domain-containing protein
MDKTFNNTCPNCIYFFIFLFLLLLPETSYANSPDLLQEQGISRVDNFIDHFRKTGDYQSRIYDLQIAEQELFTSYKSFVSLHEPAQAALSLVKLGDSQRMQKRWKQAVAYYSEAYTLAEKAKHPAYQAKALMGRARAEMYGLRDYDSAAMHIDEALRLGSALPDKNVLFDALDYKAQVQISRGDLVSATDSLNRAFSVAHDIEDKTLLLYGHLDRADLYQKLAEKCDYQRTFAPCYEALERSKADYEEMGRLARSLGYGGLVREAEGFLQRLEWRRQLIKSQEQFHSNLLQAGLFHPKQASDVLVHESFAADSQYIPAGLIGFIEQAGGFSGGDARSYYIQGLLHDMQGDKEEALASYLTSLDLLESDRRKLKDDKSRGTFLEEKIEFYYAPILLFLDRGEQAKAFNLLERSRSRAMTDLLASRDIELGDSHDRQLFAESKHITATIAGLQKELFFLSNKTDHHRYTEKIEQLNQKIAGLEKEYQKLLQRIRQEAPSLQELLVSDTVTLQTLQNSMARDNYEVLQYLIQESAIIVWHISSSSVQVKSVFLPRSELITKVSSLRKSIKNRDVSFEEQTSQELFLFLIQPVLQGINSEHLVIIPHEDLHYVPFQVLQNPQSKKFLGEEFQVSYAPNATILNKFHKGGPLASQKILAAADPDIIEAAIEVENIGALYPAHSKIMTDPLIKESDVKDWAGAYNVHHLSVHGFFDPTEPLLSFLQLGKDNRDDGKLTAAEMFGLNFEKSRLVVLSACETGQAEATHANEIIGMVRGLLYAGGDSLILSSWQVDAASTTLWMENFYKEARDKPLTEAARLALLAVKMKPEFQHPYFWGSFVMVGR